MVLLKHSYRFEADSGIGQLTQAINAGEVGAALSLLEDPAYPEIQWVEPGSEGEGLGTLVAQMAEGYAPFLAESEAEARLAAFDRFRVLSAYRHGVWGVEALNRAIEIQLGLRADREAAAAWAGTGTPRMHRVPIAVDVEQRERDG